MNSWETHKLEYSRMATQFLESQKLPYPTPEKLDVLLSELVTTTRAYWLARIQTEYDMSDTWYEAQRHKRRIEELNHELENALNECRCEILHNREVASLESRMRMATLLCEVETTGAASNALRAQTETEECTS